MERKRILELEVMLGRTPDGRYIGEKILEDISAVLENGDELKSFTRCKLCGFQMVSDAFFAGCPNCGCKDTEELETRSIENTQDQANQQPQA